MSVISPTGSETGTGTMLSDPSTNLPDGSELSRGHVRAIRPLTRIVTYDWGDGVWFISIRAQGLVSPESVFDETYVVLEMVPLETVTDLTYVGGRLALEVGSFSTSSSDAPNTIDRRSKEIEMPSDVLLWTHLGPWVVETEVWVKWSLA